MFSSGITNDDDIALLPTQDDRFVNGTFQPKPSCCTRKKWYCLAGVITLLGAAAAVVYFCFPHLLFGNDAAFEGPWDAAYAPNGDMFYTEKCRGLSVRTKEGQTIRLFGTAGSRLEAPDFFCLGQSGMHGVALDPNFGDANSPNGRDVYVFFASDIFTPRTNRVARLTLGADMTPETRLDIITDIMFKDQANQVAGPGAHSGGRVRFGLQGSMWKDTLFVTSGDNHNATLPQDLWGLGSKVFAVDRDGAAWPSNAIQPPQGDARIFAYGFRNVQGIAFRPGSDQIFIAEHGPGYLDEVTMLVNGGNGGWDPQNRPGLNCPSNYCGYAGNPTTMPMTDTTRFPEAMLPVWDYNGVSAGMSPCVFLDGEHWGEYEGWLAVGIMGNRRVVLMELTPAGALMSLRYPNLRSQRYRSLVMSPEGTMTALTDEGDIFEITPQELFAAMSPEPQ